MSLQRQDSAPDAAGQADAQFLRALGDRVRLLRARRGMTRRVLSTQSGVSERYLAQMEAGSGNVSVLLLRAIALALAVPVTDLLADNPDDALDQLTTAALPSRTDRDAARQRRIALIGLRGAGKSTLGSRLARACGVPFHELDREIEREAGMELRAIFELHGQAGYRRLEREVLERLLARPDDAVIAVGGGIVADAVSFALLLRNCRTIWLRASPGEHMQRVIDQGDLRPMHDNRQAMEDLRSILSSREALYARADRVLDTSGRTADESFSELQALLGEG